MSHLVWRKSSFSASQTACVEVAWRKSSYSGNQTACVEVAWRKSSFSGVQTDCVEVARPADRMAVRDSKNPDGPILTLGRPAFVAFLSSVGAPRG